MSRANADLRTPFPRGALTIRWLGKTGRGKAQKNKKQTHGGGLTGFERGVARKSDFKSGRQGVR